MENIAGVYILHQTENLIVFPHQFLFPSSIQARLNFALKQKIICPYHKGEYLHMAGKTINSSENNHPWTSLALFLIISF